MNYPLQRRQHLTASVKKLGVDALLVNHVPNVTYLTGFTGDASYYLTTATSNILVSDTRFEQQIAEECPGLDTHIRGHNKTTPEAVAEVLNKTNAKNVGVEASRMSIAELAYFQSQCPQATFVPLSDTVEALRVVKDPSEVESIRTAVQAAERAYRMFVATLRESDTEKDMVDALEGYVRRAGGRCTSFPPIVAVGDRGALPHAPPTSRPLSDGSKLLIDWGADLLYKSDITRTIRNPFGTNPTRQNEYERVGLVFEEVYEAVLAAQNAAIAAIRPGVNVKVVDAAARKALASARLPQSRVDINLADHFTHGLGHGIGLEIHEAPRIRENSDDVLAAGMVVTIEPGVYIPGWGGVRIEDDVLVTPDGARLLTTLPRELG